MFLRVEYDRKLQKVAGRQGPLARRSARSSSPRMRCVANLPFLAPRTAGVAVSIGHEKPRQRGARGGASSGMLRLSAPAAGFRARLDDGKTTAAWLKRCVTALTN